MYDTPEVIEDTDEAPMDSEDILTEEVLASIVPPPKSTQYSAELFNAYQSDPTPDNLGRVVKSLDPVINKTLVALGETSNPQLRAQAKIFAARAVKKYDPQYGAQLHTWVANQLMQLRRARRTSNSPIKVPERIQIDAYYIDGKMKEFIDDHGREPDMTELSDITKIPVKRIAKVREQFYKVPGSAAVSDDTQNNTEVDFMHEAVAYLYDDVDYINKKIIEHRTGYGGQPIMSNSELSTMLGVRPDVVSKRSARIGTQLERIYSMLHKSHG
jgi:hypothetical protein